jgi:segregation and condensation protein B
METLAVVAYKQPVTRAEVEKVRGVACGELIRQLMEKGLVRTAGRHDSLGRPQLYGTTKKFLQAFGLNTLKDLPDVEALRPGGAGG